MRLADVIGYGPIVAIDEDTGAMVTINGAYVNLWIQRGEGEWANTDCRANSEWGDLYKRSGADMIERGEECLREWLRADECDED